MRTVLITLLMMFLATAQAVEYLTTPTQEELSFSKSVTVAIKYKMKDPDSAQFRNIYFGKTLKGDPVVCGEVNAKNSYGGYVGFARFYGLKDSNAIDDGQELFKMIWQNVCMNPG